MKKLEYYLEQVIEALGMNVTKTQKKQIIQYIDLLLEGSKRQRLVGEKSGAALIEKHICDALYPLKLWSFPSGRLLDLGTGAGLPGIPLKICLPEIKLYLIDANRRKINFLRRVAAEMKISDIYFLSGRAEKWGQDPGYREHFNCVVSRAVARAAVLAELALPLVKIGGVLVMYKGKRGLREIEEAKVSIKVCGGRMERYWRYHLPTGEERTLIIIKKIEPTPSAYPRRVGKPAQKPLGV